MSAQPKTVATSSAEIQSEVNQACSSASNLKTTAYVMWAFLGLSFIPTIPLVSWGFIFTFIAVLVMIIRWKVKFGNIQTEDPNYLQTKRSANLASTLWLAALVFGFMIKPVLYTIAFS